MPASTPAPSRSARVWSSDLSGVSAGKPCRPHGQWIVRSVSRAFTWQRYAAGLITITLWTMPMLALGSSSTTGWGLAWAMLIGSLLGTIPLLALIRSVMLELGCDRSLTPAQELPFAWHWRRSACAVGLSFALVSLLVFAGLSAVLPARSALALAGVFWWMGTTLGCAAISGDGADTIDALQRAIIYTAHRPLTACITLLPPAILALGLVSTAWMALSWWSVPALLIGGVFMATFVCGMAGAYFSLRYANDAQEPAELWDSGPQITMGGGWLKAQPPSQANDRSS